MKNSIKNLIIFLNILLIVLLTIFFYIQSVSKEIEVGAIFGKNEYGGKCYLQVEIECTPDEYIGYELGDDYILKN